MSVPLTARAPYQVYPGGGAPAGLAFADFYWPTPEDQDEEEEEEEEEEEASQEEVIQPPPAQDSDLSPVTSTSGFHLHYTPDSATSPNGHPLSPQPSPAPHTGKGDGEKGGKKKSRTTFSQEQLQVLHLRFQTQKYLSPQQIRELGTALGLTYKQVKTWFQNQRMKFKRTQRDTLYVKKGLYPPQPNAFQQSSCLDFIPPSPQDYSVTPAWNIHPLANAHEGCASNQTYNSGQSYPSDYSLLHSSPQSFYPVVGGESGGFLGKAASPCYSQQAISYISQQKMNFYHGFSASVEYAAVKMEDGYPFPSGSSTSAAFPGSSIIQHYQTPGAEWL